MRLLNQYILIIFTLMIITSCSTEDTASNPELSRERTVFKTGIRYDNGEYIRGTFQPTIISTNSGSILIFAQGRLDNSEDNTHKTLIFSKSNDLGKTWSPTTFLTKPAYFWGVCAFSFLDDVSGKEKIVVMMAMSKPKMFERYSNEELLKDFNINSEHYDNDDAGILYQLTSIDNGNTWTKEVVNENFLNNFDNNGNYISFFSPVGQWNEITEGPNKGRFLICGPVKSGKEPIKDPDDIYDYEGSNSTIIYSDNKGKSWQLGGMTPYGGNESSVVSINAGKDLLMIRRRNDDSQYKRIANYSSDGGQTWSENKAVQDLPSPKCLGVMLDDGDKLIYSTPKTTLRTKGRIFCSYDDGNTWVGKTIHPDLFSYSDIEHIKNTDKYIVAYSHVHHGEFGLCARTFDESWLP